LKSEVLRKKEEVRTRKEEGGRRKKEIIAYFGQIMYMVNGEKIIGILPGMEVLLFSPTFILHLRRGIWVIPNPHIIKAVN